MVLRRPTAVVTSAALHGVAAVLVLQLAPEPSARPGTSRVIYAQLVRLAERPAVETSADPTPRADEPPPIPAAPPATDPPAVSDQPANPDPAPSETRARAPERPVAAETRPPEPVETEASPAPIGSTTNGPQEPQPLAEVVPLAPQPVSAAASAPSPDAQTERITVAAPQQAMLAERFADWTGRTGEAAEPTVWKHSGREYTAVFRPLPADDSMGIDRLIVEISTEHGGRRVATEVTMKRLAFSSFAQFVDRWDPEVQIHDDEIDGRFHSNSEINLLRNRAARPIFRGRVTTASRTVRSDSIGRLDRQATFLAGLETGVRKIFMPPTPFSSGAPPRAQTRELAEDSRIVFRSDGTYTFSSLDNGSATVVAIGAAPHYIVAKEDAVLHVRGIVRGRVLVYAPNGIVIEDDLTYAEQPTDDPTRGDYLGLVSDRSITIAEPDVTGPGDLAIHASIYARRQFAVRSFRSRESGTLYIFGSVSAGSVTATEPRYSTKIEFDERLEHWRAPGFPQTDRYELETWDAVWRPAG
jgi:hypothetical protein